MQESARTFCQSAIAYLKVAAPDGEGVLVKGAAADSPVLRPLGNGLVVAYVVDDGGSLTFVQKHHLAKARMDLEDLHEQAMLNLANVASARAEVRKYGNLYLVLAGGCFEASFVLCEDFWNTWYEELAPNGFVAAFPARDVLAFGDADKPETYAELRELCAETSGSVLYPLTQRLYKRIDGAWSPILTH
jgi:uncharacterized protein YtpQ (UPF0354 family)